MVAATIIPFIYEFNTERFWVLTKVLSIKVSAASLSCAREDSVNKSLVMVMSALIRTDVS